MPLSSQQFTRLAEIVRAANARVALPALDIRANRHRTYRAKFRAVSLNLKVDTVKAANCDWRKVSKDRPPVAVNGDSPVRTPNSLPEPRPQLKITIPPAQRRHWTPHVSPYPSQDPKEHLGFSSVWSPDSSHGHIPAITVQPPDTSDLELQYPHADELQEADFPLSKADAPEVAQRIPPIRIRLRGLRHLSGQEGTRERRRRQPDVPVDQLSDSDSLLLDLQFSGSSSSGSSVPQTPDDGTPVKIHIKRKSMEIDLGRVAMEKRPKFMRKDWVGSPNCKSSGRQRESRA